MCYHKLKLMSETPSSPKLEHLHVRTSAREKRVLQNAARLKNMSVSQFILQCALPAAETAVREAGEFGVFASHETLSKVWDSPEEDRAWADL